MQVGEKMRMRSYKIKAIFRRFKTLLFIREFLINLKGDN